MSIMAHGKELKRKMRYIRVISQILMWSDMYVFSVEN